MIIASLSLSKYILSIDTNGGRIPVSIGGCVRGYVNMRGHAKRKITLHNMHHLQGLQPR